MSYSEESESKVFGTEISETIADVEENNDAKPEKNTKGRMYVNYETVGGEHTVLTNNARVSVEPLVLPEWVDRRSSEMKEAENKVAEGVDLEDEEDLKNIHQQLEKSKLEGSVTARLAPIFREFGDQVCLLKRSIKDGDNKENAEMNASQLGNIVDFDDKDNLFFVISHTGKDKMRTLLENQPKDLVGSMGQTAFRIGSPINEKDYFNDGSNKEIGFSVWVSVDGKEKRISFLFSKTNEEAESGENIDEEKK